MINYLHSNSSDKAFCCYNKLDCTFLNKNIQELEEQDVEQEIETARKQLKARNANIAILK